MAANELEDKDQKLWRLKEDHLRALDNYEKGRLDYINELVESEKVKAVEEYRQKLNAYWPEGSEEPTLSAEQMKTILNRVLKERNK